MMERLSEFRLEYGREKEPFEIHVISMDGYTVEGLKRLADVGVTDVIIGFRNSYEKDETPLQKKLDSINTFADLVISKI